MLDIIIVIFIIVVVILLISSFCYLGKGRLHERQTHKINKITLIYIRNNKENYIKKEGKLLSLSLTCISSL